MTASTVRLSSALACPAFGAGPPPAGAGEALSSDSLEWRVRRTPAGDVEACTPEHGLPVGAREMLSSLKGAAAAPDPRGQAVAETWLVDAMRLFDLGLIRTSSFSTAETGHTDRVALLEALLGLSSDGLYTLLTRQAKHRLGLLQGFRMVLALERCEGHPERRALAVRFVQEIWRSKGESGLRPLQQVLGV